MKYLPFVIHNCNKGSTLVNANYFYFCGLDVKLFKLLLVYCGRTSTHKLAGVLYLWERYYISKAVGIADYHGKLSSPMPMPPCGGAA